MSSSEQYSSRDFDKTLNHVWDKHGLVAGFSYVCGISDCTKKHRNIQSYRRHVRDRHTWFYDLYIRRYDKNNLDQNEFLMVHDNQEDEANVLQNNSVDNEGDVNLNDIDIDNAENEPIGEEYLNYKDFDHDVTVASFLLGLREKFNSTTEAIRFVSEKVHEIVCLELKIRMSMIKESLRRNHENFLLDYETSLIIDCVSPFAYAFDKFKGQKSLDEFVQKQKFYVAPKQINIGFDEVSQKEDSIQYVPLLSTLDAILQHEDVLSEVLADTNCNNNNLGNKLKSFKHGTAYKENKLFSSDKNTLQICLYHDDFNIANPLGNKTQKYKISAFYFVIGNLSAKFKSCLKDIHLTILSPAYLVGKYGIKNFWHHC